MRSTQKSNRTRGRGNRKSNGNNLNRVYDSSGPEGKVRGTPQQIIDKYLSLARDAQTSGDRVMAENFLQHAEHYQRILLLATANQPEQRRENGQAEGEDEAQPETVAAEDRDRGRRRGGEAEPAPGEGPQPEIADHAVGGLTTIDTDTSETLLVTTEETAPTPPPTRRRRPGRPPKSAEQPAEPSEPAEPVSEAVEAGPEAN
ncbi:MAG: DUF4167 domain-containing protein [Pseudomonadota bacterium]